MEEAYNMAVDALGLALTDRIKSKEELPKASDIENIEKTRRWCNCCSPVR